MVLHVALNHKTAYRYDRLVNLAPQLVRLRPAPHCRTRVLSYSLKVEPTKHFINWQQDPFGNYLARLVFPERTREFCIEIDLVAEMSTLNPFDFFVEPSGETFPLTYETSLRKDLAPYLECEPAGPLLQTWLASVPRAPRNTVEFLVELNQRLQEHISYVIRLQPGVQICEETLTLRRGSCRDSGWLLVQILRHLGLAARFVSGYLIQLKPDVEALDGPSGAEHDFTDLHAWAEVYLPGAGWIGFDPTSGLLAGEGHLPLAATPDPQSAAPITGAVEPSEVDFGFEMSVKRLLEQPRVTKPYSEATWQEILAAGEAIDERLLRGDVRLTVGGEPTFVSIDDRDGAEWSTAAVGPTKRVRADDLVRRLHARFAPGGLIHHGQGKWYPGEQLPRWAFALYWRGDGQPLWRNSTLIAGEEAVASVTSQMAERFMLGVADRLGIPPEFVLAAFEDPAHFLVRERMLPINLDPSESKLADPMERDRLARVFDRGLDQPTGFVLPVQRWQSRAGGHWRTERWSTRRDRLFLIPGDSPAGFRLPLGSLPWLPELNEPQVVPLDPFAARASLPVRPPVMQDRLVGSAPSATAAANAPARTALAAEPRDGRLCIFLPPTESGDAYAELVTAIEDVADELQQPVHLEGYTPPSDARLNVIKVTPDPGVIEVNIHPSASWKEQVAITEALYEEARLARLDTCKFMLDGRQIGTGGGNHVVVGGQTPADSPFLRRPDLLASLVTYWQNHPSLSYLFSGLFIGPTSQAPRIDEARDDQLYELEIALSQIPDPQQAEAAACPPWLVDRIFRNLLVDVTGNTHRAEICIDKLYSPDGPAGRLGLVEFRAFEMPPHARMSLAQQLVLRALLAWFWEQPYRQPLIRFGTELHDKYMLPYHVWHDFERVCFDLSTHGLPIQSSWFQTHFEFRFPYFGHVTYEGITIELRTALEPWHVLGEEGALGGTVRYVDSSLERLQVKVEGLDSQRWAVTCNRRTLPLQRTGARGTQVAGVRFRAWQPSACLHPTIGVHAPLVFDLVDRWNERSLGGCTYHVMHPAGRNYEALPVNELEAEGRRLARFERSGHTPGPISAGPAKTHPEFPHTLDLRRFS